MAKTKKNIKRGKKGKNNNVKFNNTGLTEFVYKEGNQSPKKMTIKWDNDGKKTKINMNTNIDGKEKKTTLNLSNDKIKELLGATKVVDEPIDQRLINDFSMIILPQQQQQQQQQQIVSPFNEQILFLTEEPIMRDIDLIPMSSIKSSSSKSSKSSKNSKSSKSSSSKSKSRKTQK
jgi:hypothetical protein